MYKLCTNILLFSRLEAHKQIPSLIVKKKQHEIVSKLKLDNNKIFRAIV